MSLTNSTRAIPVDLKCMFWATLAIACALVATTDWSCAGKFYKWERRLAARVEQLNQRSDAIREGRA